MRIVKIVSFAFVGSFFLQCKGYDVRYDDSEKENNYFEKEMLLGIGADSEEYSVLYIGGGFYNDHLLVTQGDEVLFDNRVHSDSISIFSRAIRIVKGKDLKIIGLGRERFVVKKTEIAKYKYIYFNNIYVLKRYSVLYSNTLFGRM